MTPNAFNQASLIDSRVSLEDNSKIEYGDETRKRNYATPLILTLIAGALTLNATYDKFRPTVRGEIIAATISNTAPSQIIIENEKTKTLDTLILNTAPSNTFRVVLGNPSNYQGQANTLSEKLKPGTFLEAKTYSKKNNEVYNLMNITLDKNYKKLQTASFN